MENRNLGDLSAPVRASTCLRIAQAGADRCWHAQAGMKRVYELDAYKLTEELSNRA
ncbi:MAG: hypothetical protein U9R17_04920 [Thermodesulfobacteriota bacterium]|nr:hypothetical protein [Thermodesulfobacteriota bacterium]